MIKKIMILTTISSAICLSQSIQASGFSIIEHSASGLGQAFAGASAVAEDASTVYFNPAGMTYLKGSQVTVGLHIIKPKTNFSDKGSNASLMTPSGPIPVSLGSEDGDDAGGYHFVPNFYYVTELNNGLHFGLGVNSPVGLNTTYDSDWVGRYTATESDLKTLNINPSLAFKVNDSLSIGAGISLQYIEITLGQKTYLCGHPQLAPSCNPTSSSQVLGSDATPTMTGDSWSGGFNLGFIYQPIESTRIGLSYRSKVKQSLEGYLKVEIANGYTIKDENISADLDIPEVLSLSITHQISSKTTLLGDVTYTGWSSFEQLKVDFEDGTSDVTKEDWSNSMRYSLGLKYQYSPSIILRTGIALDETPISDKYRTSRIPGDERKWLSLGITYKMNEALSMDIGYAHLWVKNTTINEEISEFNGAMGGQLVGEYNSSVDILSAQVNWTF